MITYIKSCLSFLVKFSGDSGLSHSGLDVTNDLDPPVEGSTFQ
jgi:hypothetical protein